MSLRDDSLKIENESRLVKEKWLRQIQLAEPWFERTSVALFSALVHSPGTVEVVTFRAVIGVQPAVTARPNAAIANPILFMVSSR